VAKKTPATPAKTEWTAAEIAALRGCKKVTVIAKVRQINEHRASLGYSPIGRKVSQTLVFTVAERDELMASIRDSAGNPTFGPNYSRPQKR